MRQAQAAIAQKQDIEQQRYIDSMVKDLVVRFKSQQKASSDGWTSPIGAVSILGFQNKANNSLMGRLGLEGLLKDELTRELAIHNVSVVERHVLDKVLQELKLGSSDLTHPKTRTKLGKITAAHVLATGSFHNDHKGSVATMRLVETETTNIFLSLRYKTSKNLNPSTLASQWANKIAAKIKELFPLQGRLVKVKNREVILNLGKRHAVSTGMVFNVLSEGEAIDLGDGEIEYDYEPSGQIKVTRLKHKMAYASILSKNGTWAKHQKIVAVMSGTP